MRPVLLIAQNFAREQRWPLFFLLLWVLGWATFGIFEDPRSGPDDVLMIFRQLAVYSVTFGVFFGSSAIQADQRSRRILAVLSKGISRGQYIFGLLSGIALVLGVFCVCMGFTATWLLGRFGFSASAMWFGMLALWTACLLTASLTLTLSTFMPPLFAAISAGTLAGIPALLSLRGDAFSKYVIPVHGLLEPLIRADFSETWHASLGVMLLAWAETGVFWLLGAWIFSRRDLSVPLE
jgi:ABC-type transport system involved in multi-copper enzyme maturation permease subunit